MHQSGRPVWGWRETLALPRPQKIIRPAHTPLKSDFYNKIGQKQTHALQQSMPDLRQVLPDFRQ
jgi:hypothetical protein